jgi:hypothetical protein
VVVVVVVVAAAGVVAVVLTEGHSRGLAGARWSRC